MSYERHSDWPAAAMTAEPWIDSFGQMVRMPFDFFTFGMELFGRTLRGFQDVATPGTREKSADDSSSVSRTDSNKPKEDSMADTNLSDDKVKMVSYSIVSIQRGNERALVCNECKVFSDNMTAEDFVSWVVAEYCQQHDVPADEKKYLRVAYEVEGRWHKQELRYEEKQLESLAGIEKAIRENGDKK